MPSPPDSGCGGCLIEDTIKISSDQVCTAQYCFMYLSQSPPINQLNFCLQESNKSTDQELYKRMMAFAKDDPDVVSRDLDVHLSKVLLEKYAFLGSNFVLDKWAAEHCEITVLPVKLTGLEYFSIFLPKDSVITSEINDVYVLPSNRGFPTRMVYLYIDIESRYTVLAGNPRNCISVFICLSFCLLLSVSLTAGWTNRQTDRLTTDTNIHSDMCVSRSKFHAKTHVCFPHAVTRSELSLIQQKTS